MIPETILYILIGIIIIQFLFDEFLGSINQKHFEGGLPEELDGIYTEEKYETAVNYGKDKGKFGLISSLTTLIATLIVLKLGYIGQLSDYIISQFPNNEMVQTLVFFGFFS